MINFDHETAQSVCLLDVHYPCGRFIITLTGAHRRLFLCLLSHKRRALFSKIHSSHHLPRHVMEAQITSAQCWKNIFSSSVMELLQILCLRFLFSATPLCSSTKLDIQKNYQIFRVYFYIIHRNFFQ